MSIDKSKKRVQITIPKEKYRELKIKAIDNNTTISELLLTASDVVTGNYNAGGKPIK